MRQALLFLLTIVASAQLAAVEFRADLANPKGWRLQGHARHVPSASSIDLTDGAGQSGYAWIDRTFRTHERVAISCELSMTEASGDFRVIVSGMSELAVAIRLEPNAANGPPGPRVEIEAGDPPELASVVMSSELPDLITLAAEQGHLQVTAVVDRERISIVIGAESRCFTAREVASAEIDASIDGVFSIGVAGVSRVGPTRLRVHQLQVSTARDENRFVRGDCNLDGNVCGGVTDLITIAQSCFLAGPRLACEAACDANDDGRVCGSVSDIIYLANYCYLGSRLAPPPPFPHCGLTDGVGCETPSACGQETRRRLIAIGRNESGFRQFLRDRDGMVLVEVPAGEFEQGDHFRDYSVEETPVHRVAITRPFLIGKYEVTNAQYRRFLDAIDCESPTDTDYDRRYDFGGSGSEIFDGNHYPEGFRHSIWAQNSNYFEDPSYADYPVLWVDWFDAVAYGRWAADETSTDWSDPTIYGIPSESQWEYAARWNAEGTPRRYPWGGNDGPMDDPANIGVDLCNYGSSRGRTLSVCSLPLGRSRLGVYHQAGNAYEWTADWYDGEYYSRSPLEDPFVSAGSGFRQLRGGGWFGVPFSVRGAYRCNFRPEDPDGDVGFRASARSTD